MKNTGLQNRFPPAVRSVWVFWYSCMLCGRNRIDALHHVVSPSSHFFVKGDHNKSVYNSCPIHNFKCHIGNEAFLYNDDTIKMLLKKVEDALAWETYKPNEVDRQFLKIYSHLYMPYARTEDEIDEDEEIEEDVDDMDEDSDDDSE